MTIYRTPDGKSTTNSRRYIREWRAITRPIEKGLGLKTIGFDPDLLMTNPDGRGSIEMPLWFAKRLAEKLGSCKTAPGGPAEALGPDEQATVKESLTDEQNQGGAQGKGET